MFDEPTRRGDPPEPGRLRQRPRRPRPAAERSDRRPAPAGRQRPAGAADDRRTEHRLRRLLARARGPLGDGRAGRRDAGQPLRRPRPHLRRLRPRLPPLHPGNDRKKPADPGRGQRRPAGDAARSSTTPHASSPRCSRARKALAETSPVIAESLHAGVPVLNASPVLNNQLQPTAEALVDFQEAPGVFNGLDLLIDTNELLKPVAAASSPRRRPSLQLLVADLQEPGQLEQPGQRPGQLAQLHLLRAAGRAEQRGRPVAPAPANGPEPRKPPPLQPLPEHRRARASRTAAKRATRSTSTGKTVIGNAPEALGNDHPRAGEAEVSRLPERDTRQGATNRPLQVAAEQRR